MSRRQLDPRAFLLQDLTATERQAVEEQSLLEDRFFDELLAAEDDLLDEAARGELSESETTQFVGRLERVESWPSRVKLSKALADFADEDGVVVQLPTRLPPSPNRAFQWSRMLPIAASLLAAVGLAGGFGWVQGQGNLVDQLAVENSLLRGDTQQLREGLDEAASELAASQTLIGEQRQAVERLTLEGAKFESRIAELEHAAGSVPNRAAVKPATSRRTVAFLLGSTYTRGEGEEVLREIPPNAEIVRLQLELFGDTGYESFAATVTDRRGQTVQSNTGLALTEYEWGAVVEIELEAGRLAGERYDLELEGVDRQGRRRDVGFYSLSISR